MRCPTVHPQDLNKYPLSIVIPHPRIFFFQSMIRRYTWHALKRSSGSQNETKYTRVTSTFFAPRLRPRAKPTPDPESISQNHCIKFIHSIRAIVAFVLKTNCHLSKTNYFALTLTSEEQDAYMTL